MFNYSVLLQFSHIMSQFTDSKNTHSTSTKNAPINEIQKLSQLKSLDTFIKWFINGCFVQKPLLQSSSFWQFNMYQSGPIIIPVLDNVYKPT